ncbi:MAG: HesA/MoeB/ThiF family protein [Bacteroidetes bacterium]|nr:HesA/MoeB/ThiF family protein [Bacteroidota bacterium]
MLNKEEINRYSRQIILSEIGADGQEKLKRAKVLVVGAGGLGCPVLQYLVSAGIGEIGIVDDDKVDESNLQRQILYNKEEVGLQKAEVAKKKLQALNPLVNITSYILRLTSENALHIIKEYDLVIDGSDNFPTRYLVNDACVMLNKPLVFGSIFKFEGQVSVFNYKNGPTYRCLFPEPPQDSPNCAEIGVLGVLPGIIGTLMANEALKIILGIGEVLSGKLFVLDALSMQTQILYFEKNVANAKINSLIDYENFCKAKSNSIREISAEELIRKIKQKEKIQIIDVREPSEYSEFNINGENISLHSLSNRISEIKKDIPVIIHCQRGNRSKHAIELLQKEFGFTNLLNLTGGIESFNNCHSEQREESPENIPAHHQRDFSARSALSK